MLAPAVPFAPDVETLQADESQTRQLLSEAFDSILERTSADYGHAVRSVHAKSYGILEGELIVDAGLPPQLAQGLFSKPGAHKVHLRMSTNAGDILPDVIGLPRGLAIKVMDVEGPRLPGAEGRTQDFLFINRPTFNATTAQQFLGSLKLLAQTTDRLEGTKRAVAAVMRGAHKALDAVVSSPARWIRLAARAMLTLWGKRTFQSPHFATVTISPSSAWPRSDPP